MIVNMKKRNMFLLASAAAAGVYGAVMGKGIFNKPRFREQHSAVSRYVDAHYPGAVYSPIEATPKGYMTFIKRLGKPKIMLYAYKSPDGVYVFHETEVSKQ